MNQMLEEYTAFLKKQKMAENTSVSYAHDVEKFSEFLKTDDTTELLNANTDRIKEYVKEMKRIGKANSTISRTVASLRKFYSYQYSKKRIKVNPTYGIELPKAEKSIPGFISAAEAARLLEQPKCVDLKGYRDKAMLELLYATGIKISELISLSVRDADVKNSMIVCTNGKTHRYIPIGKAACVALENYINNARPLLLGDGREKTLFLNCFGKPMTRQGFWKILRGYADAAGIKSEISAQTLRHSFAMHLLQNGADIGAVSEMLGHKDIAATRKYNQVLKEDIKRIY